MMFDLESVGEAFGVLLMQVCLTALAVMFAACTPCLLVKATGRPLRELWRKSRPLFAALALLSAGAMIHAQKTNGVFMTGLTGLTGLPGTLLHTPSSLNPVNLVNPVQTTLVQNGFAERKSANWNVRGAWKDSFHYHPIDVTA